jgi:hypothetical protein
MLDCVIAKIQVSLDETFAKQVVIQLSVNRKGITTLDKKTDWVILMLVKSQCSQQVVIQLSVKTFAKAMVNII